MTWTDEKRAAVANLKAIAKRYRDAGNLKLAEYFEEKYRSAHEMKFWLIVCDASSSITSRPSRDGGRPRERRSNRRSELLRSFRAFGLLRIRRPLRECDADRGYRPRGGRVSSHAHEGDHGSCAR